MQIVHEIFKHVVDLQLTFSL